MPQQPQTPVDPFEEALAKIRAKAAPPTETPLRLNRRPSQPPMILRGVPFRSDATPDEMTIGLQQSKYPGSPLERIVDEWWNGVNPLAGQRNMPVLPDRWADAPKDIVTNVGSMLKNIVTAPGIQLQKAINEAQFPKSFVTAPPAEGQPDLVHAGQHALASVIPLVGPALGETADQIREGDPWGGVGKFGAVVTGLGAGNVYNAAKAPVRSAAGAMVRSAADAGTMADWELNLNRNLGTLNSVNRDEALLRATPTSPSPPPPAPPTPGTLTVAGRSPLERTLRRSTNEPLPAPFIAPTRGTPNVVTPGTPLPPQYPPMREPPAAWMAAEDARNASAAEALRKGSYRAYAATQTNPENAMSGLFDWLKGPLQPKPRSWAAQKLYNTTTIPDDLVRRQVIAWLLAQTPPPSEKR